MAKLWDLLYEEKEEIEKLFQQVTLGDLNACQNLIDKLLSHFEEERKNSKFFLPHSLKQKISDEIYENNHDSVFNEFLIKLQDSKILWKPSLASLRTYIYSILFYAYLDLQRSECSLQKKHKSYEESLKLETQSNVLDFSFRLKEKYLEEFQNTLSCRERILVKMRTPYLTQGIWEGDEEEYLLRRYGLKTEDLNKVLYEALDEQLRKEGKKIELPTKLLSELLKNESVANIDQTFCRIRKKVSWLHSDRIYEALERD
jgi:hypothetical protein